MVTLGFLVVLALLGAAVGVAAYLLSHRETARAPSAEELPVDRAAWTRLAALGAEALKAHARSGAPAPMLRPAEPPPAAPGAPPRPAAALRETEVDPTALVGRGADELLKTLGPPDRTAAGEAWFSPAEGAHYVLRPGGGIVKLAVFGAIPSRIAVGEPYLRWSWEALARPAGSGEATTWTFCLTADPSTGALTVAELLTHPAGAHA